LFITRTYVLEHGILVCVILLSSRLTSEILGSITKAIDELQRYYYHTCSHRALEFGMQLFDHVIY